MLRRKLSKSCVEDNTLSISYSGEQRPKRYRTGVLNFWDFEHIATLEEGSETLPAVVRDVPEHGSFVVLNHKKADESKLETSSKNTTKKVIPKKAATRRSSGEDDGIICSENKEISSKDDQNGINDGFKKPNKILKKVSQTSVGKKKKMTKFSESVTLTNHSILKDEENSAHLNKKKSSNKNNTFSRSLFDNAKTCRVPKKKKDKQSMNEDNSNCSISSKYEELNALNYSPHCSERTSPNSNCAASKNVHEISENESNTDVTDSSVFKKPSGFKNQKQSAKSIKIMDSSEFDSNKTSKVGIVRSGQQKNAKLISNGRKDQAKRVLNSPQKTKSKIVARTKVADLTLAKIKKNSSENQLLNDPCKLSRFDTTDQPGKKRISNGSKQAGVFNDNNSFSSSDFGYSSCSENIIKENAKKDLKNPAKKICQNNSQPDSINKLSVQFSGNKDNSNCQRISTDRCRPSSNFSEACNDTNNGNQNNKQSNELFNQMGRKKKVKNGSDETSQESENQSSEEFEDLDQSSQLSDDQDQLNQDCDDELNQDRDDESNQDRDDESNQDRDNQLKECNDEPKEHCDEGQNKDLSEDPNDSCDATSNDPSDDVLNNLCDDVPNIPSDDLFNNLSDGTSNDPCDDVSNDACDDVSNDLNDGTSNDPCDDVTSNDLNDGTSNDLNGGTSNDPCDDGTSNDLKGGTSNDPCDDVVKELCNDSPSNICQEAASVVCDVVPRETFHNHPNDGRSNEEDSMRGEDLEFLEVSDEICTYRIARGLACDGLTPYMVSLIEGTLVFQTPSQATVVVIEGRGTLEELSRDKTVGGITVTLQRASQFLAVEGSILRLCKEDSSPQMNMCIILDED